MREKGLIAVIILIVVIIAIAYMLKGLAEAPLWFLIILIIVIYLYYRKSGRRFP